MLIQNLKQFGIGSAFFAFLMVASSLVRADHYVAGSGRAKDIVKGPIVRLVGTMSVSELKEGLAGLSFDDDKVELVSRFAESHGKERQYIYMSQVADIFKSLAFDDTKIEVASLVSEGIVDRGNFGMLLEHMSLESNKTRIAIALGI